MELPCETDIKMGLFQSFLQAQAMILWLKGIESASNVDLSSVQIKFHKGASATKNNLGGNDGTRLFEKAKEIEKHISEVVTDLKPSLENDANDILKKPYCLFDAIEHFVVGKTRSSVTLRPMVMLDDVHTLHFEQLSNLINWLEKKERKIARWMFRRLDTIDLESIFSRELNTNYDVKDVQHKLFVDQNKEITYVWLQNLGNKRSEFQEMANKYLCFMPVFTSRGLTDFSALLSTEVKPMSNLKIETLKGEVENFVSDKCLTEEVYQELANTIWAYLSSAKTKEAKPMDNRKINEPKT